METQTEIPTRPRPTEAQAEARSNNPTGSNAPAQSDKGITAPGTVSTARTVAGRVGDIIRVLGERGDGAGVRSVASTLLSKGPEAAEEIGAKRLVTGDFGTDEHGKALYYGPHPFLAGPRFGLWKVELREQMEANRAAAAKKEEERQERARKRLAEEQARVVAAQERQQARANKLREQAAKLMAQAKDLGIALPVVAQADTSTPTETPDAPASPRATT
jgi:hypothetical protein